MSNLFGISRSRLFLRTVEKRRELLIARKLSRDLVSVTPYDNALADTTTEFFEAQAVGCGSPFMSRCAHRRREVRHDAMARLV
jgi:hypothetical protein